MITRFAPSPTGPLHLGHAYSALVGWRRAQQAGGTFLLRIEDLDRSRARPEWEAQIFDDLHWLGLDWPEPVMRQSARGAAYADTLDRLWQAGLLYECRCSRRDIETAASAPQEGAVPVQGPDGIVYPGTCRPPDATAKADRPRPAGAVLRLDLARALQIAGPGALTFRETGLGPAGERGTITMTPERALQQIGDVVLARKGMDAAYHLAVVVDDAAQAVTEVCRGDDLFSAAHIHALLHRLLGHPPPTFHHHRLIRDDHGRRLAKRDDARSIASYRAAGLSPKDLRALIGL